MSLNLNVDSECFSIIFTCQNYNHNLTLCFAGQRGPDGRDGRQGRTGATGPKGQRGPTGAQGFDGREGKLIYTNQFIIMTGYLHPGSYTNNRKD